MTTDIHMYLYISPFRDFYVRVINDGKRSKFSGHAEISLAWVLYGRAAAEHPQTCSENGATIIEVYVYMRVLRFTEAAFTRVRGGMSVTYY